jgi:hypothetical protein
MILPLVLAAGALYFMFGGKKAKIPPSGAPAADWHDAIADATAEGNPSHMRALADKLDAEGYSQAAADLRTQADAIEAAPKSGSSSSRRYRRTPRRSSSSTGSGSSSGATAPAAPVWQPVSAPRRDPEPVPKPPPTTSVMPPPDGAPDNGLEQAMAISRQLAASGPWREPRSLKTLVRAFQTAHGLTADGLYGPEMARHIAAFGIVPTTPYYWPSSNTRTVQKAYRQFLLDKAGEDPPQGVAWLAAAKRVVF